MIKFFILFFIFISFISCKNQNDDVLVNITLSTSDKKYVDESDFFEEYLLYKDSDTIQLYVNIDECGEWGGPKETIKIFTTSSEFFQLNYRKHKFNCDSIPFYYNNNTILDFEKNFQLRQADKKHLSEFFLKLMKAKINEKVNSNAGSYFSLSNTDSTMILTVHTDKTDIIDSYENLLNKLNLK